MLHGVTTQANRLHGAIKIEAAASRTRYLLVTFAFPPGAFWTVSVTFPHFSKDDFLPRQACGRRCETRSGAALSAAVAMELTCTPGRAGSRLSVVLIPGDARYARMFTGNVKQRMSSETRPRLCGADAAMRLLITR